MMSAWKGYSSLWRDKEKELEEKERSGGGVETREVGMGRRREEAG